MRSGLRPFEERETLVNVILEGCSPDGIHIKQTVDSKQ